MVYVKCDYGNGLFTTELVATFRAYESSSGRLSKQSLFVLKEHVIPSKEEGCGGLVKAVLLDSGEDRVLVGINDVGEYRISCFAVPKEDILLSLE